MISLVDALLTFLVLAIAAFLLWRGSLAPLQAAEHATEQIAGAQVTGLASALMRVTVDQVDVVGTGVPKTERVPTVLTQLLDEATERNARPLSTHVPAVQKLLDNASRLGNDRWSIRIDVQDPSARDRAICLGGAEGTPPGPGRPAALFAGKCAIPEGRVITQLSTLPSGYQVLVIAFQEVAR